MTRVRHNFATWIRKNGPAFLKENLAAAAIVLLALATLPIIALLLITVRAMLGAVVALAVVFGLVAYAASPGFRRWLKERTESLVKYKGLRLATDVRLHPSHSWARMEGDVSVGVDDLLQAALGPVDDVELPPRGLHVTRGDRLFRLRHADRIIDVRSPVSGTVLGVNPALRGHPQLINEEPFAHGWAVRLHCDDPGAERRSLLCGKKARTWFQSATDHVAELLPESAAAAVGEELPVGELYRRIDDAAWRELTETVFTAP